MTKVQQSPQLLVVDDDLEIRSLLARYLTQQGYRVTTAKDADETRRLLQECRIDLVILDVMLPGEDGLSLCRWMRSTAHTPVIMLTAMGEDIDRILGLEMGADDYLPKPFNPRELLARIKAVLRRTESLARPMAEASGQARFAGWTLDLAERRLVSPAGEAVELTAGEHALLVVLATRPRRVLSREQLLDLARGRAAVPFDRSIDVQISRLRHKLEENPGSPRLIVTVRGEGYIFAATVERA